MTIQEILRDHGVEFASAGEHHHARPNWLALRSCPFCSSQNYHLGWNLSKGFFNCWKCRGHRTVVTLIRLGVPYPVAVAFSKDKDLLPGEVPTKRIKLVEPPGRGPLLKIHRDYLRGRGFDPEALVKTWELEGIGRGSRLAWRIYIPIHRKERRVSWTTRAVGERIKDRYISAGPEEESMNHKDTLYGLDFCRHAAIVVEGPADAWNIGPGAVATFGTSYSDAQVLLLSKIPYRWICFDSSVSAQKTAELLASELAPFPGETRIVQLNAEDPGMASRKEVGILRKMTKMD
jgi:hypothetical protein